MENKKRHLSLRIDDELLRKFDYAAKYDDRSKNWLLLSFIRKYVADFEEKHGEFSDKTKE